MNKLLLFTTSWLKGTHDYVALITRIANEYGLKLLHYDSEVNASESLVKIYDIRSSPTLVVELPSGEFKKLAMFQDEDQVKEWLNQFI